MQIRNSLFVLLLMCVTFVSKAQKAITWKDLGDVELKRKYFKEYDMHFLVPIFGKIPKSLEGESVSIAGYVLPLDSAGKVFALSMFPYASCFFCGGAGPETVIELQLASDTRRRYKMDEWITFSGILKLNNTNPDHFNYILQNAKVSNKP